MPRKPSEHLAYPKGWPTLPFLMRDSASINGAYYIVCERTVGGWRAISSAHAVYWFLTDYTIYDHESARAQARGKRFYAWEHNVNQATGEVRTWDQHLQAFKRLALQEGATPEAIRLLDLYEPLNKKEVDTMAAKKLEKQEAKKTPKAAPAAEGKPKSKGNPEALKKAREAAADKGPDVRKVTMLTKENPYRAESKRAIAFDTMAKSKTVQDYKDAGGPAKYVNRWAEEGLLKLS